MNPAGGKAQSQAYDQAAALNVKKRKYQEKLKISFLITNTSNENITEEKTLKNTENTQVKDPFQL